RTGRIRPLFPISNARFLVGQRLSAPVFPGDTLVVKEVPNRPAIARLIEHGAPGRPATQVIVRTEDVEFKNGSVTLAGTLSIPPGRPPFPAIVLIHGSGAQMREGAGPWIRFFNGIGLAVLAYDKRGVGKSTGDWLEADLEMLAEDARAAFHLLQGR